jgi:poly(A) polymerase
MTQDDKRLSRSMPELPPRVREVVAALRAARGEVYLVGGAVRDALLGGTPTDWDLATSLRPEALASLFPGARHRDLRLGAVQLRDDAGEIAVTSYRTEAGYRDHRHPDEVCFVDDAAQDALRRDFTVNAVYADPESGSLFDPCGGVADLEDRVLRAIGDPRARLAEDPLRILRAIRLAASCGLELEEATAAALAEYAPLLHELSVERIFDELTRMFSGPGRGRALRLSVEHAVAREVLPEVPPMDGVEQPPQYHPEGDVLTHVCMVLDEVAAGDPVQAWTAVLHDVGKPATFERAADRIRFSGHDQLSAQMAADALARLHAPRALTDTVVEVCRDHIRFASLLQMTPVKRERWMRSPSFPAHLEFHRADCAGSHGDLSVYSEARRLLAALPPLPPPPLCRGADVIALGVREGPIVGEILRELQSRLDERGETDRGAALALLRTIVEARVKAPVDEVD